MNDTEKIECSACGRLVDPHARVCLYCGADPHSGEAVKGHPQIDELIPPKQDQTPVERVASTIRSRSGIVLMSSIVLGLVLLIAISTWVNQRQRSMVADVPPVPLTEVTDLSAARQEQDAEELELPELEFEFDGDASSMETFVLEEGAVAPPEENEEGEPPNDERGTMNDEQR